MQSWKEERRAKTGVKVLLVAWREGRNNAEELRWWGRGGGGGGGGVPGRSLLKKHGDRSSKGDISQGLGRGGGKKETSRRWGQGRK